MKRHSQGEKSDKTIEMSENPNQPQEPVDAALCERFREIRRFYSRTQAEFAEKFGIPRSTVSDIERGALNPPKKLLLLIVAEGDFSILWIMQGREPKMKADLSIAEPASPYVTGVLPEHIAEAWAILHEAARAGGADLMAMDIPAVGEMLGAAAEAMAQGRGPEARLRAVRRAEVVLRAMGKGTPAP